MPIPPPLSPDEPIRLEALRRANVVETPIEERFERITRMAQRVLNVRIAAISLVEADREWYKSVQGSAACEGSRDASFCGHAVLQEEPFVVEDARLDPRFRNNPMVTEGESPVVFYAGVPLHAPDGSRIGMLCIKDGHPRQMSEEDLDTLRDLASLAETELRTASASRSHAGLVEAVTAEQRRGMVDPLTRVWNRAGITDVAQHAMSEAGAGAGGVALLAIDLDGFKRVNDTLGHAAGDEVLRVAAKRMLSALRESDVLGRLGGDEFLVVLAPCASVEEALGVGERVRQRLSGSAIATPGGAAQVSASLGVKFVATGNRVALEVALEEADRAMYRSKHGGRDRVAAA